MTYTHLFSFCLSFCLLSGVCLAAEGQPTRTDYPNGLSSQYTYDKEGRLLKHTMYGRRPDWDLWSEFFEYEGKRLVKMRDRLGNQTLYRYNKKGELVTEIHLPRGSHNPHDSAARIIDFTYTETGELLRETVRLSETETIPRLKEPVAQLGILPDTSGALCSFNSYGDLISVEKNGETTFFEYGVDGNCIRQRKKRGDKIAMTFNGEYDAMNRLIAACSEDGIHTNRTYNGFGELIEERTQDRYGSYSLRYEYDRAGRLKKIILPDNSSIQYAYEGTFLKKIQRMNDKNEPRYAHEIVERDEGGRPIREKLASKGGQLTTRYEGPHIQRLCLNHKIEEKVLVRDEMGCILFLWRDKKPTVLLRNEEGQVIREEGLFNWSQKDSFKPRSKPSYRSKKDSFGREVLHLLAGGKKAARRFLYIGTTEIGWLDYRGRIKQLKIPKEVQQGHAAGMVAIEKGKRAFVPVSDIRGNTAYLLSLHNKVIETYLYSERGEERVYNREFKRLQDSSLNPWRYQGKRG